MGSWRPIHVPADKTVVLEAQAAITEGDPVKLATNGCNVAGDGDAVFGVAASSAASGASCVIYTEGVFAPTFGASIAMGARVAAAASGTVDAGTSSDPTCGIVVKADVTSGARGWVMLTSSAYTQVLV